MPRRIDRRSRPQRELRRRIRPDVREGSDESQANIDEHNTGAAAGRGRQAAPTATVAAPHSRSTLHVLAKTLGFAKTAERGTRGAWSLSTRTLQLATGVREPRPLPAASARRGVVAVVQSIARFL